VPIIPNLQKDIEFMVKDLGLDISGLGL
jgi:hypothetical protein